MFQYVLQLVRHLVDVLVLANQRRRNQDAVAGQLDDEAGGKELLRQDEAALPGPVQGRHIDAGHLSGNDVVAIGGSGKGADTALILKPTNQSDVFDMRIREVVCKPRVF